MSVLANSNASLLVYNPRGGRVARLRGLPPYAMLCITALLLLKSQTQTEILLNKIIFTNWSNFY